MRGLLPGASSSSAGSVLAWLAPLSSIPSPSAASPFPLNPPLSHLPPLSTLTPPAASAGPPLTLAVHSLHSLRSYTLPNGPLGSERKGSASWPLTESSGFTSQLSSSHRHSPLCSMSTPLHMPLNPSAPSVGRELRQGREQGTLSSPHVSRLHAAEAAVPSSSGSWTTVARDAVPNPEGDPPSTSDAAGSFEGSPQASLRQGLASSPVIVISGPTASGKTRLAIRLALLLGGEIVSADSIQVYRGLDIGSAKSPLPERMGVPHHVIDILDPWQEYTAGDFFDDARAAVREVQSRGKVPVVVGGTGLYLRWFLYGKPDTPRSDPAQVEAVEQEIQEAIGRARAQASAQARNMARAQAGKEAQDQPQRRAPFQAGGLVTELGIARDGARTAGQGVHVAQCTPDNRAQDTLQDIAEGSTQDIGHVTGEDGGKPEVFFDEWAAAVGALAEAGDPLTASQLARNDWYRLKRAFTILRASGQPRSMHPLPSKAALRDSEEAGSIRTRDPARAQEAWQGSEAQSQKSAQDSATEGDGEQEEERGRGGAAEEGPPQLDFDFRCFFLAAPRGELYRRIDRRCEDMVAEGLLKEALMLRHMGLHPDSSPATRGIGYRQALHFLAAYEEALGRATQESLPLPEAKALFLSFLGEMQQASRNLAKRQTTWFRKERLYTWLDASLPLDELVSCVLEGCQPNGGPSSGAATDYGDAAESLRRQSETDGKMMKGYAAQLQFFNNDEVIESQVRWLEGQLHSGGGVDEKARAAES